MRHKGKRTIKHTEPSPDMMAWARCGAALEILQLRKQEVAIQARIQELHQFLGEDPQIPDPPSQQEATL